MERCIEAMKRVTGEGCGGGEVVLVVREEEVGLWDLVVVVVVGDRERMLELEAVVKSGRGHSQQRPRRPKRRFRIWR